jgi:hypothetical protein
MGHNLAMPPSDSNANGNDRDVLTSLPRTRPARRSAKRDAGGRRPARTTPASGASSSGAGPTPPEAPSAAATSDTPARAKARATAEPKAARSSARASSGTAAKAASKPTGRTRAKAAAKPRRAPARTTAAKASGSRSRTSAASAQARAAEAAVPPAGYATSDAPSHHGPDPFAMVSTAVHAAGEIAQIGATLWGQAMRSAISRLPRP